MSAIAAAFQSLFADPNMARDATYTPKGGSAVSVRVVLRRPDRVFEFGETRLHAATTLLDIRVAAPLHEGDVLGVVVDLLHLSREDRHDLGIDPGGHDHAAGLGQADAGGRAARSDAV